MNTIGVAIVPRLVLETRLCFKKTCKKCGTVNEIVHIQGDIPQCCYNCFEPLQKQKKAKTKIDKKDLYSLKFVPN